MEILNRLATLVVGAAVLLAIPHGVLAQQASEASVKAAFLFKFPAYVDWPPAQRQGTFVFGVLGADDVAHELSDLVQGRTVNNRPAAVRVLKEGEPLTGIHLLFVGRKEAARLPAIARAARPGSVLVVSDSDRGLELGSVINLVPVDDRVGFEVSMDAAERSSLAISSRMLGVARRVVPKGIT